VGGTGDARRPIWVDGDDSIEALLDRSREHHERDRRAANRWERQIDQEGATWTGWLVDAAENRRNVVLRTTVGAIHGQLRSVGLDALCLREGSTELIVANACVLACTTSESDARGGSGDRGVGSFRLIDRLALAHQDGADVQVTLTSGLDRVGGKVHSVGTDVFSVGEQPRRLTHVRIDAVAVVRVAP
jgi:hypothetical protein